MIITTTRVATGGGANLAAHLADKPEENEVIDLVDDDIRAAIALWESDAEAAGCKYAIRHVTINPEAPISEAEAREIVADWLEAMGSPDRDYRLVMHGKARADGGTADRHWHFVTNEYDPVSRRVLNSSWQRPTNELVARKAEARLGESITHGWWSRSVANQLDRIGEPTLAAQIRESAPEIRPESAFTREQHQRAQRKGVDLAAVRQIVKTAWSQSDGGAALVQALYEEGLEVKPGNKPGRWIVVKDSNGLECGALHRLAGVRLGVADAWMREAAAAEPDLSPSPAEPVATHLDQAEAERPAAMSDTDLDGSREMQIPTSAGVDLPTLSDIRPDRKDAEMQLGSFTVHPAQPEPAAAGSLSLSQAGIDLAALRQPSRSPAGPSLASLSIGGAVTAGSGGGGGGGGDGEAPAAPSPSAPKSAWSQWRAQVAAWLQRRADARLRAGRSGQAADQARADAERQAAIAAQRAHVPPWLLSWGERARYVESQRRWRGDELNSSRGLRYGPR